MGELPCPIHVGIGSHRPSGAIEPRSASFQNSARQRRCSGGTTSDVYSRQPSLRDPLFAVTVWRARRPMRSVLSFRILRSAQHVGVETRSARGIGTHPEKRSCLLSRSTRSAHDSAGGQIGHSVATRGAAAPFAALPVAKRLHEHSCQHGGGQEHEHSKD